MRKSVLKKFGQKFFTLPYINSKDNNSGQELYLVITGGTGRYIYSSSNPDIVETVQDTYLVAKNKGKANIVIIDNEMNSNMDNIDIYVKDINSFTFMEERQEILKGNKFEVTPIALIQNNILNINSSNIFQFIPYITNLGFNQPYTFENTQIKSILIIIIMKQIITK